jgi:hypothetical protein
MLRKTIHTGKKYVRCEKMCMLRKNIHAGKKYVRWGKMCMLRKKIYTLGKSTYTEKTICKYVRWKKIVC